MAMEVFPAVPSPRRITFNRRSFSVAASSPESDIIYAPFLCIIRTLRGTGLTIANDSVRDRTSCICAETTVVISRVGKPIYPAGTKGQSLLKLWGKEP